jgi:hypothetical protein
MEWIAGADVRLSPDVAIEFGGDANAQDLSGHPAACSAPAFRPSPC